jgi:CubicO group peptidase (beta-lactamase class C family)
MSMETDIRASAVINSFNGVILIAKDELILYFDGFGFDNIEEKTSIKKEAVFRIGSITKQFTALAILQLVQAGKIRLADNISSIIKDVPYEQEIQIHHLLANSSGIPNFSPFEDYSLYLAGDNFHEDMIRNVIFKNPLNFTPGERFEYSSSGYFILSYIIELITNKSYSKYLEEKVFLPLGMIDSGFCFRDKVIPGFTSLYDVKDDKIIKALDIDMRIASGGGGLYSSALDLHKWNLALCKKQLISENLQEKMFSVQTPINDTGGYGYGVISVLNETKGKLHKFVYHPGNGPGVYAQNTIIDNNIQLIMLSNINDSKTFRKCNEEIENLLLEYLL